MGAQAPSSQLRVLTSSFAMPSPLERPSACLLPSLSLILFPPTHDEPWRQAGVLSSLEPTRASCLWQVFNPHLQSTTVSSGQCSVFAHPVSPLTPLTQDFPGGAVVKNPLANAGDTGSSPGPGRSHMPWSNKARAPQLLSLHSRACEAQLLSPRATATEVHVLRDCTPQQEKPQQ